MSSKRYGVAENAVRIELSSCEGTAQSRCTAMAAGTSPSNLHKLEVCFLSAMHLLRARIISNLLLETGNVFENIYTNRLTRRRSQNGFFSPFPQIQQILVICYEYVQIRLDSICAVTNEWCSFCLLWCQLLYKATMKWTVDSKEKHV